MSQAGEIYDVNVNQHTTQNNPHISSEFLKTSKNLPFTSSPRGFYWLDLRTFQCFVLLD